MYTNVPKDKSVDIVQRLLAEDSDLGNRTKLSVNEIVAGIRICLKASQFTYKSKLYNHKEGLAIGSPISPILANLYMEDFEKDVLAKFSHPPRIWWRYVDDTFVIIQRKFVDEFLNYLNTKESTIRFKMQLESDKGQLPFLDCLVHRNADGRLKTTLYQKPTDTDRILHYRSAHPKHVYASIACSMFRRVNKLCTDDADRRVAQNQMMGRLTKNGYPKRFLRTQLAKSMDITNKVARTWQGTVVLPYKPGTSEAIRRVFNNENIRVAFKPSNSIGSRLVRLKDKIPKTQTRNCVYCIKCTQCTAVYIGQTARELGVRIAEHRRRTQRFPRNLMEYNALIKDSAIAGHALDTGHTINFSEIKILRQGFRCPMERMYAEAIEITKSRSAVNRIDGVELSGAWKHVIGIPK